MRNLLIPTDFTPQSLRMVELAAQTLKDQSLNITLFHAFNIPSSSFELLGGRRVPYVELLSDEFRNACKKIKNLYPRVIHSINVRHCYGSTVAVFRNFIDAHDIDVIFYPENYQYVQVHPLSVNPDKMFRNAGIPVLRSSGKSAVVTANVRHQDELVNESSGQLQFEPIPALSRS